jgi:carbon monoxide dehydrogenase subunit G
MSAARQASRSRLLRHDGAPLQLGANVAGSNAMRTVIALALVLGCRSVEAGPPEIRVFESQDDSSVTQGETTVTVDPNAAYEAVTDYARWSTIFPDIHHVIVTSRQGEDARVTLVHLNGDRDNVHFHNQPAARLVWFEDTGGRAEVWAEIVFLPGDQHGTTRVRSRLYADVHGLASLFVSDAKLRGMRQQRIRDDLTRLRLYFARELQAASGQAH